MRVALAQINLTVGDLAGNVRKIEEYAARAEACGADLVVFPEMTVTGYPPEDLLLKPRFVQENIDALYRIAPSVTRTRAVVGFVDRTERGLFNAAAVIDRGRVAAVYHKMQLPNYGVFDEKRYFLPGDDPVCFDVNGVRIGINICEDIWSEEGPARVQCGRGAQVIAVLNASPYHAGKVRERERIIRRQARAHGAAVVYVNLVGGQDELVFDGYSMVVGPDGRTLAHADGFREDLLVVDIPPGGAGDGLPPVPARVTRLPGLEEEVYQALVLGLRDYVAKNGFRDVVLGLSGGIDSALVTVLAVDALGSDRVHTVFMPTRYSSHESREDAEQLARNLGASYRSIPIDGLFDAYLKTLEPFFEGRGPDIAEENLQARIRGNIVMALSNKFGWLVLATGNKSEMSTGYATLYGDMAGGFALIKDVPKTLVYRLSRYRNTKGAVIPERIITREPTAELRPDQKDSDSLPVYEDLDPILRLYVEDDRAARDIVALGYDEATVGRVVSLVDRSEYKRRQSPPGIKITPKSFGRDRRMPITNKYR